VALPAKGASKMSTWITNSNLPIQWDATGADIEALEDQIAAHLG